MTSQDSAQADGQPGRRRRRRTWVAVGGGVLVVAFLVFQLFGFDLTDWIGAEDPTAPERQDTSLEHCRQSAEPDEQIECRMVFIYAALDDYWLENFPPTGAEYEPPGMDLFSGGVNTRCGQAPAATGPFYCPTDTGLFLETEFFEALHAQYGAEHGPLAEMYVVAHLWAHHLQNLTGILAQVDTGPAGDPAQQDRLELQADCLAGAWAGDARTQADAQGRAFLPDFAEEDLNEAITAVQLVAQDYTTTGVEQTHPETWSHTTAEQRQDWFTTGYESGPESCDTFALDSAEL